MNEFYFVCHNCGTPISAEDDLIGEEISCPACAQMLVVPVPNSEKTAVQKVANRNDRNIVSAQCLCCGTDLHIDDRMIGEKIPCPNCNAIFHVSKTQNQKFILLPMRQEETEEQPEEILPPPAPQPAEASGQAPQKENADKSSHRINFFMIGLLILLNIQFGIFLYSLNLIQKDTAEYNSTVKQMQTSFTGILSVLSAHIPKTNKIVDLSVEHYNREQFASGLYKAISKKIQAGYEPVGKICNDGINGAYYLFIKRSK